jgi:hypothetical protein
MGKNIYDGFNENTSVRDLTAYQRNGILINEIYQCIHALEASNTPVTMQEIFLFVREELNKDLKYSELLQAMSELDMMNAKMRVAILKYEHELAEERGE